MSLPRHPRAARAAASGVLSLALAATAFAALAAVAPLPAGASCIGPSIQSAGLGDGDTMDRGRSLVITGRGWGDNCYDTGIPPGAHGTLGNPDRDIEVAFVQGSRRITVATGNADGDYEFRVRITVPDALEPGPASLVARSGDIDVPLTSVDQPFPAEGEGPRLSVSATAATGTPTEVTSFGQDEPPSGPDVPAFSGRDRPDDSSAFPYGLAALGAIGLMGLVAGLAVRARRRR